MAVWLAEGRRAPLAHRMDGDTLGGPETLVKLGDRLRTFAARSVRFGAAAHAIKDGATSPEFLSVLVDTARSNGAPGSEIPSEAMASVIDVRGALDLATFRESYERIADAKAMPKAEPPPSAAKTVGVLQTQRVSFDRLHETSLFELLQRARLSHRSEDGGQDGLGRFAGGRGFIRRRPRHRRRLFGLDGIAFRISRHCCREV